MKSDAEKMKEARLDHSIYNGQWRFHAKRLGPEWEEKYLRGVIDLKKIPTFDKPMDRKANDAPEAYERQVQFWRTEHPNPLVRLFMGQAKDLVRLLENREKCEKVPTHHGPYNLIDYWLAVAWVWYELDMQDEVYSLTWWCDVLDQEVHDGHYSPSRVRATLDPLKPRENPYMELQRLQQARWAKVRKNTITKREARRKMTQAQISVRATKRREDEAARKAARMKKLDAIRGTDYYVPHRAEDHEPVYARAGTTQAGRVRYSCQVCTKAYNRKMRDRRKGQRAELVEKRKQEATG